MKRIVSVIIPVRNEADTIESTLDNITNQDYPAENFEIIVADGVSDDGTTQLIREYSKRNTKVKLVLNRARIVPTGLNLALSIAKGDVIVRMDAHSFYPHNYISTLVDALYRYDVSNVGCTIKTIPGADTSIGVSIAIALSSMFGVGNSLFRTGVTKPTYVDTVPFGCFKKEVFETIGLFDEELVRNQDDEFNARMIKRGYKILLLPDIECSYQARATLKDLTRMLYQYGLFKPLVNKKIGAVATIRQLIPLLFVFYIFFGALMSLLSPLVTAVFLLGLLFYLVVDVIFAIKQSVAKKDIFLIPYLLITYPAMHISYGLGYIAGLWRLYAHKKKLGKDMKLSR